MPYSEHQGFAHGTRRAQNYARVRRRAGPRHVHIDKGQIVVIDGHHVRGDRDGAMSASMPSTWHSLCRRSQQFEVVIHQEPTLLRFGWWRGRPSAAVPEWSA